MPEHIPLDGAWDAVTGTARGAEIDLAVRPLMCGELPLAPKLCDLEERLAPVFDRLGIGRRRVSVVSVGEAVASTGGMDPRRAGAYVDGLCALLPNMVERHLGVLVDDAYRQLVLADARAQRNAGMMMFFVVSCLCAERPLDPSVGTRFTRALHGERTLRTIVFYLATAIAFGLDGVEHLRALAALCALGNFPVGIQRDGSFVVLVA